MFKATEGRQFQAHGVDYEVRASCGGRAGRWMCLTYRAVFASQLEKDAHIGKGRHEMVWICVEHGPEVP